MFCKIHLLVCKPKPIDDKEANIIIESLLCFYVNISKQLVYKSSFYNVFTDILG